MFHFYPKMYKCFPIFSYLIILSDLYISKKKKDNLLKLEIIIILPKVIVLVISKLLYPSLCFNLNSEQITTKSILSFKCR